MLYFLILPGYAGVVVMLLGASLICRFIRRLRPASGYLVGGAIGTLPLFILMNALVWIVGLVLVWIDQKLPFPHWAKNVTEIFVGAALLIGPLIASAVGMVLGFVLGSVFVYRRRTRRPHSQLPPPGSAAGPPNMTHPVGEPVVPRSFKEAFGRWFFLMGRFLLVFWAVTIVNTIAWAFFADGVYDCTDPGLAGYWEPGHWVHGSLASVAKVVHHRPMSEPDTIKAGWSQTGLFGVWLAMFLLSLVISFWLARWRWWKWTVSVVEWIFGLGEWIFWSPL